MKKITTVLTLTALAATLLGGPNQAQAQSSVSSTPLAALTAKGYDPSLASNALAATTDAAAMLAAINSVRSANGLAPLMVDPSLSAATAYQTGCQAKWGYAGNFGITNGKTWVYPAQMAADYGSAATAAQEFTYSSGFFPQDADNWPAMISDWQQSDSAFAAMLNSAAVNVAGINLIDTGSVIDGHHIYKWALIVGYIPSKTTAKPAVPTLAALTAKGYDPSLASNALAATTDTAAMLAAINSVRCANGLVALRIDGALSAATAYQTGCQAKWGYAGNFGITNGKTWVYPAQMAADYGSAATAAQEFTYSSGFFPQDADNWPAMISDWQQSDSAFAAMLNSAAVNVAGINLIDTGSVIDGHHIYKWALIVGYIPNKTTGGGPTGPTLHLTGLDPALAALAMAAQPTKDETNFLAAINTYRGQLGHQPLTIQPALEAAAYYTKHGKATTVSPGTLAIDFGSLYTTFVYSSNSTAGMYGYVAGFYGQWSTLVQYWAPLDPTAHPIFADGTYSHCGLSMVDTGTTASSALDGKKYEVYAWTVIVGK